MEQEKDNKNQLKVFIIVQYEKTQRVLSVAVYSSLKRLLQVGSYNDNQHYTVLESLLVQLESKDQETQYEVYLVYPQVQIEVKKIGEKIPQTNSVKSAQMPQQSNLNSTLQFLLQRQLKFYIEVMSDSKANKALNGLLAKTELVNDKTNSKQLQLQRLNFSDFLKLDKAVINALVLFPKKTQNLKTVNNLSSLYDYLNRCKSVMGSRCLKRWMKQPLQSIEQIKKRFSLVSIFVHNPTIKSEVQSELKKLPDLDNLYYNFYKVRSQKKVKCDIDDLRRLYQLIKCLGSIIQSLDQESGNQAMSSLSKGLNQDFLQITKLAQMIERNVVMDDTRQRQFYIKPEVQKELMVINKEKERVQEEVEAEVGRVAKYLASSVTIVDSVTHRKVLETSKQAVQKVKAADDFRFISSKQNKISFTTNKLARLMEQVRNLDDTYKKAQQQILKKMFKTISTYYPVMERISYNISELDVYCAFATVVNASLQKWSEPTFSKDSIKGQNLTHPLISKCVPNDVELTQAEKTIILTGPNMGGKSTYIRTVGLCVYLAHIGCFVPASRFETPMVDAIITRVGASDVQIKGISTFMSQMVETSCMLKTSTDKSLILIDQLGRGTSTHQGFGLAWGICQYLHQTIKPFCIFATHYHEMTKTAQQIKGIKNMYTQCSVDRSNLTLEYKVVNGIINKSFGIQVAKMVKFPERVIKNAQKYLEMYQKAGQNLQANKQAISSRLTRQYSSITKERVRMTHHQMQRKLSEKGASAQDIQAQYRAKIKSILDHDGKMLENKMELQ